MMGVPAPVLSPPEGRSPVKSSRGTGAGAGAGRHSGQRTEFCSGKRHCLPDSRRSESHAPLRQCGSLYRHNPEGSHPLHAGAPRSGIPAGSKLIPFSGKALRFDSGRVPNPHRRTSPQISEKPQNAINFSPPDLFHKGMITGQGAVLYGEGIQKAPDDIQSELPLWGR